MKAMLLTLLGLYSLVAFSNDSSLYRKAGAPFSEASETYKEVRKFRQVDKLLNDFYTPTSYNATEFSDAFYKKYYDVKSGENKDIQKAANATALVEKEADKRLIDRIEPDKLVNLPVGLVKKLGSSNEKVTLAISQAKFTPEFTEITVYCKIELPQGQTTFFLGGENIRISRTGSFIGEPVISLLANFPIYTSNNNMAIILLGGSTAGRTGPASNNLTYAKLDCSGVKELQITGEVLFSRNTFTPLGSDMKPVKDLNTKVKSQFSVKAQSFNDIIADLDFSDPFTIAQMENNVAFKVVKAVWDFSDTQTPNSIVFPENYKNLVPGKREIWKGIYVKELRVWALPSEFNTTVSVDQKITQPDGSKTIVYDGGDEPASFGASDVIIDNLGLTGHFAFNNLTSVSGGILGCRFSINDLMLNIETNKLTAGGFRGRMALPVQNLKDDEKLTDTNSMGYEVAIVPGAEYTFKITEKGEFGMGMWQAKATVGTDSYLKIYKTNKWHVKAVLNGSMGIEIMKEEAGETPDPNKNSSASFKGILFQEMMIQSRTPYFQVKYLGYNGEIKLNPFPVSISELAVSTEGNDVTFGVKVSASLMENKIGGSTKIRIVANVKDGSIKADTKTEINGVDSKEAALIKAQEFIIEKAKAKIQEANAAKAAEADTLKRAAHEAVIIAAEAAIQEAQNTITKTLEATKQIAGTSTTSPQQEYTFKNFLVDAMELGAEFTNVKFSGSVVRQKNDSIMGTGWQGSMRLEVPIGNKPISVQASGAFGRKEKGDGTGYSYFYIDALASGFKVPIGTGLNATAFGGGISYNMFRDAAVNATTTFSNSTQIKYVPDNKYSLALKAVIGLEDASGETVKGLACFDMVFTRAHGLSHIGLSGKVNFFPDKLLAKMGGINELKEKVTAVTKIAGEQVGKVEALSQGGKFTELSKVYFEVPKPEKPEPGKITALFGMTMDFENSCFHSNLDIYANINVASIATIKGGGPNGLAGWGVMYANFKTNEFYIHLGRPDNRNKLNVNLLGIINGEVTNYFMTGTQLPDPPLPPNAVTSMLGMDVEKLGKGRDRNALRRGFGFAMGMEQSIAVGSKVGADNTKGKSMPINLYLNLKAGFGTDVMAKFYRDAQCADGRPIGQSLNGFYAVGQAYAYINGDIGAKVKIGPFEKNISLLRGAGALLVQAKLPDPFYLSGKLALELNALGLITVRIPPIGLAIGRDCEIVDATANGPLAGIDMIADMVPTPPDEAPTGEVAQVSTSENTSKVDVFTTPEVAFNLPVGQAFQLEDESGVKNYRIRLSKFDLLQDGQRIPLKDTVFHSDNYAVNYETTDILPPNSKLKFEVEVGLEQQKNGNWVPVYQNGEMIVEQKVVEFTTGDAPTTIPKENIAFMYPVKNQKYFYPKEHAKAYIKLKKGQPYLFKDHPEMLEAQFKKANGYMEKASFTYDNDNQQVVLELPGLENNQNYTYRLVRLPEKVEKENIGSETTLIGEGESAIEVEEKRIEGATLQAIEHEFLTYDFTTSRYNTFEEKMRAKKVQRSLYEIILSDVGALQAEINSGEEAFEIAELKGTTETNNKPLIQAEAVLTDAYYQLDIKPLVYDIARYMEYGIKISRDTSVVGFPPVRGVDIMPWYTNALVTTPEYNLLKTRIPSRYSVVSYYKQDFISIQLQAVNKYVLNPNNFPGSLNKYLEAAFPLMRSGNYEVALKYVLPGGIISSSYPFKYTNPIK